MVMWSTVTVWARSFTLQGYVQLACRPRPFNYRGICGNAQRSGNCCLDQQCESIGGYAPDLQARPVMSFHAIGTKVANSKGVRLNAALYLDQPALASGEYVVNVIAPKCLRVRANRSEKVTCETESDPMLGAFLAVMKQQLSADPVLFTAINRARLALIKSLVTGSRCLMRNGIPGQLPRAVRSRCRMRHGVPSQLPRAVACDEMVGCRCVGLR